MLISSGNLKRFTVDWIWRTHGRWKSTFESDIWKSGGKKKNGTKEKKDKKKPNMIYKRSITSRVRGWTRFLWHRLNGRWVPAEEICSRKFTREWSRFFGWKPALTFLVIEWSNFICSKQNSSDFHVGVGIWTIALGFNNGSRWDWKVINLKKV